MSLLLLGCGKSRLISGGGAGGGAVVSTTNLVSFWKLDESSGTRYDAHGSNDLTDNNTVAQGTGNVYANCAEFVRANSEYLSVAYNSSLLAASDFSVMAWINADSLDSPINTIISRRETTTIDWFLGGDSTSGWYFMVNNGGTNYFSPVSSDSTTGAWICLVGRFTAASNEVSLFVSGTEYSSTASGSRTTSTSYPLEIGGSQYGDPTKRYFDGRIEAAAMWTRALSDAEITALANPNDPFYDQF